MPNRPYTAEENELARQLFAEATARGTLKAPRTIAALALSNGNRQSLAASSVTYRDYLADARRILANRRQ